jgi:hypothetical protein
VDQYWNINQNSTIVFIIKILITDSPSILIKHITVQENGNELLHMAIQLVNKWINKYILINLINLFNHVQTKIKQSVQHNYIFI